MSIIALAIRMSATRALETEGAIRHRLLERAQHGRPVRGQQRGNH